MNVGAGLITAALACGLGSCRAPLVHVTSDPHGARALLDGRPLPDPTPVAFELPYHGTMLLELEAPAGDPPRPTATRRVTAGAPLSRWVFPFDLPIEAARWLLGDRDLRVEAKLEQPERAPLDDARSDRLLEAARRAAVER